MSNNNIENISLKGNNYSIIQVKVEEDNNEIQEKRNIEIYKTKFLKIPYFYFGNTFNFYLPYTKVSLEEFKYPIFSLGHGRMLFLLIILYLGVVYSLFYIFLNKYAYSKLFDITVPIILLFMLICSFILFLINPGIIYKTESLDLQNTIKCEICGINYNKNLKVKHCKLCNVCVTGFDHHCGVIGKCIGKKNYYLFILTISFLGMFQFIFFYKLYLILDKYYLKKKSN